MKRECWTCRYQQRGGITLLGYCLYFEDIGEEKKEIPPNVVDNGCKLYVEREAKKTLK